MDNSIIDSVSIEDAHRYNNLHLLSDYEHTKIIFGVVKIASSSVETEEEIENRINEALKYISKEQLIFELQIVGLDIYLENLRLKS